MSTKSKKGAYLASSILCGAAFAAFAAAPALAAEAGDSEVSEIIVTGTRIPTPNLTSVSPVTSIGSPEIKAQGITRVEDLINRLPQAFAAQGGSVSNGATGTATVDLRGLGVSRTLVLIDGRRLMPGDPASTAQGLASDLNFIPSALVERVEVLTGGASAVYGADAVAGVVNFVMDKDFEGVRIDANYGIYQHKNDNGTIQDVVRASAASASDPSQFALPDDSVMDGETTEVTLTIGMNSADGKGNITAYAGYRHVEPILQGNRDYSACTLNSGDTFSCGGSGTAYPARVGSYIVDETTGNTFRARTSSDIYNYGPLNYYQRPDDRYTLGAFAHYEITPWAEAYGDLMFMDDKSTYQIAPGGIFAGSFSINCDNPLMSAQQQSTLCGADAGTATLKTVTVARRNIEGGGRQGEMRHTDYRIVTGLRGDLNDAWNYDFSMQYGTVSFTQKQTGFFQTSKIQNSLIAKTDSSGNVVCQSVIDGTDSACVPYNIFQIGGVTDEALAYLETDSYSTGSTTERVVNLSFGGDLTDYGVKTPWAETGVGVAFGTEYRREQLEYSADYVAAAGLLNGAGGASPAVNGSFDVYELYGEARIPIVEDAPFAKSLGLELGYRFSDYSTVGNTNTYKVGGEWAPVDGYRFRASYQRAVRAPNILELYSPQNVVLDGSTDPCAGLGVGDALVATCAAAFGLTTAQVLAIEENPAGQYNGKTGGNTDLKPETSNTYSVGFVVQPAFIPGFSASVDWFDIKVEDYINTIGADLALSRCLETLDSYFCNLVHRDADGSLWLSSDGYVEDLTYNTGSLHTRGVDVEANYQTSLDRFTKKDLGSVQVNFVGTWLDVLATQPLPGDEAYDCAGYYGVICGVPAPEWRHKLRITWQTPFLNGFDVSAQWRYLGSVKLDSTSDDAQLNDPDNQPSTDLRLASRSYLDLSANWKVREGYTLRLGVNNVFDKDPPLNGSSNCPTGYCNGNTWSQVYDTYGRYLFAGVTATF